jgi:hypothetical protein
VLNFTYEQIRDYLVTRHLVDVVFRSDPKRFSELVEKYTAENNNQAEGTKMFLFLYLRNYDKQEALEVVRKMPWYNDVLIEYIWDIPDEKITTEETKQVKNYLREHADDIVKVLAYSHWSPEKYEHLNIKLLFEVLEEKGKEEREAYLEAVWPSKPNRLSVFGEPVVTPRGELLGVIRDGIERRKGKDDIEREALELFEKYLLEGDNMNKLYVPRKKEKKKLSPYILYAYESYRYLMRVHKGKKKEFLTLAGAKAGYAKEMFGSIYDAIFSEAIDVKEMYDSYFTNEYKDFEHFLKMHYNIPSNIVKKFSKVAKETDFRLIEFDALSYGGDTVPGLVMSDDLFERMYNWLNWQKDEDKN